MEERGRPSSPDDPRSNSDIVHEPDPDPRPDPQPLSQIEAQDAFPSSTYIVQVPQDQIYWVPPHENALLAERRSAPTVPAGRRISGFCIVRTSLVVVGVLLTIGLLVSIAPTFVKTKDPSFGIDHFLVKNSSRSSSSKSGCEFDIELTAENPNKSWGILYKQGGESLLLLNRKQVASGKFPTFHQSKKSTTTTQVVLVTTSKGELPKEVEASMKSQKSKQHLAFSLAMVIPTRMEIGFLKRHDVSIAVTCDFTVVTLLASGSRILSQQCNTHHL